MTEYVKVYRWWDSGPFGGWNQGHSNDADQNGIVRAELLEAYEAASRKEWEAEQALADDVEFNEMRAHALMTGHAHSQVEKAARWICEGCNEEWIFDDPTYPGSAQNELAKSSPADSDSADV